MPSAAVRPARISDDLLKPCKGAVAIPHKGLTLGQMADLWAIDISRLTDCAPRHNALVDSVKAQQKQ